jgi:hypothetical protein
MADNRSRPADRSPDASGDSGIDVDDIRTLAGEEPPEEQDAVVDPDEIEEPEEVTMTELDRFERSELTTVLDGDVVSLEGLASGELRGDETTDPDVASEEGLAWVPPSDPPLVADPEAEDGIVVAAGLGASAIDEPYDDDHRSEDLSVEGDLTARIREAIRADAATSPYADRILIGVLGSTVVLRGVVDDVGDTDELVAVVERVTGVDEVRDETEVSSLG